MKRSFLLLLLTIFALPGFCTEPYRVLIIGDTHYDRKEYRTPKELRKRKIKRNLTMWDGNAQKMLRMAAAKIDKQTPFVIQVGDLIHGDGKDCTTQTKMTEDALAEMKKYFAIPFYSVMGNHDIRGKTDAAQGYYKTMIPFLSTQLKLDSPLKNVNYTVVKDRDLFVFMGYDSFDIDFLKTALQKHKNARYIFLVTHLPVLPCSQGRPEWVCLGNDQEKRRQLLDILAERKVIVLCGHIHKLLLENYRSEKGSFSQVSFNSMVINDQAAKFNTKVDSRELFTPQLLKEMVKKDPKLEGFFVDYRGYISRFTLIEGAGFGQLNIADNGVSVEFYNTVSLAPQQVETLH